MRWTGTWDPSAMNELARIWMAASDPSAVTAAANEIDLLLRSSPLTIGEEYGTDRHLVEEPLEVVYNVSPDDRLVTVLQVAFR